MKKYYLDKKVLVTGGSEGIGLALAVQLVSLGARVTILSRSAEKLARAFLAIEEQARPGAASPVTIAADVTDRAALCARLDETFASSGLPDIVITSAGYAYPGYFTDVPPDEFHRMMELNYFGIVNTLQVVLPGMLARRSGQIVNISSMAGYLGLFGYSAYCPTKYAVVGLSESLRRELRPMGIKVSVACPPSTRTPGFDEENKVKPREVLAMETKARVLSADAVAARILKKMPGNPAMIHPSFDGALAYRLQRYAPFVLDLFLRRPAS